MPGGNDKVLVENSIPYAYQDNPYLQARERKENNLNGNYSSFYNKNKSVTNLSKYYES